MKRLFSVFMVLIIGIILTGCEYLPEKENRAPSVEGDDYLILEIFSDEPDWTKYARANDPEDGIVRITTAMIDAEDVDMNNVGNYFVDYYISDSLGKTTLYTLEVEIADYRIPICIFFVQATNNL